MADKEDKHVQRRPGAWDSTYTIEIDKTSKRHLSFFIKNELAYYNSLVNDMTMRLRAFPDEILSMRGTYDKLWTAVSYGNVNLRSLIKQNISTWHENYKTAAFMLPVKDGKLQVEDKKLMMFDALAMPGKIHPNMRRNLATELLKTAITQAENLVVMQKTANAMRAPVQMLMPAEPHEKRHLQLTSDLYTVKFNRDLKRSEITIPYTDRPLIIPDHNVTDERSTILIVRQPAEDVMGDGVWQVTFMNSPQRYLLELRDQVASPKRRRAA